MEDDLALYQALYHGSALMLGVMLGVYITPVGRHQAILTPAWHGICPARCMDKWRWTDIVMKDSEPARQRVPSWQVHG